MKNRIAKLISIFLSIMLITMPMVFAQEVGSKEQEVIKSFSTSLIKWISWIAIAISLGVLFFIGIKYSMSGANEKANLKRVFPLYLTGLGIIVMSGTIASFVAVNVAGNEGSDEIYQVGIMAGDRIDASRTWDELVFADFDEEAYRRAMEAYNAALEDAKRRGEEQSAKPTGREQASLDNDNEDITYYGPVEIYEEGGRRFVKATNETDESGAPLAAWRVRDADGTVRYLAGNMNPSLRDGSIYEPIYSAETSTKTFGGSSTTSVATVSMNDKMGKNTITYSNKPNSQPRLIAAPTNEAGEEFVGWVVSEYTSNPYHTMVSSSYLGSRFVTGTILEVALEKDGLFSEMPNDYYVQPIYAPKK